MTHFQAGIAGMGAALDLYPLLFKFKVVDNTGLSAGRPQRWVYRKWADDMQQFDGTWETKKSRARAYYARGIDETFIRDHAPNICVVETFNEVWADSQTPAERQDRIEQDRAFAVVWNSEYRTRPELAHIRVALMSAAVGNSLPRESAVTALENDAVVNYHPYIAVYKPAQHAQTLEAITQAANRASFHPLPNPNGLESLPQRVVAPYRVAIPAGVTKSLEALPDPGQRSDGDWRWCSGRHHFMELEWGLKPLWILSETGPCRDYTGGLTLDPQGGWRLIWGNDGRAEMVDMMRQWLTDLVQTPSFREGRILGFHQFTSGGGNTWEHFEVQQPELGMVAELTASLWNTEPPPDPPPPPPPPPPDPPPTGDNMLPNHSFEEGWYHIDGRPELQIAKKWTARWKETDGYVVPEFRVLPKSALPPPEQPIFVWDGDYTIKAFKGGLPVNFKYYTQPVNLPAGDYLLTVNLFCDLVDGYQSGQKIFAQQGAARLRLYWNGVQGSFVTPPIGSRQALTFEYTHDGGPAEIGLDFDCPNPRNNNGFFFDAWVLEAVDVEPPPPPPDDRTWNKLVYLLPQNTTVAEYVTVQAVAYPSRSEIAFSADSAFARPGNVIEHRVVVYAPERWGGQAALEAWVDAHYLYNPQTVIEYRNFPPGAGFELTADVSQHQGVIEWETMRAKMQDEGLE